MEVLAGARTDAREADLRRLLLRFRLVPTPPHVARSRPRRCRFAEEVLRAYAYQCAMCGFDGALGHYPVGIEAAHVRWHSQKGPDEITNALALCALHHALFDLGVLGITEERQICVSSLYVARNEAGRAVDALAGKPLAKNAARVYQRLPNGVLAQSTGDAD